MSRWYYKAGLGSLLAFLLFSSCEINEPVIVPAYIHVGKTVLNVQQNQGSSDQDFKDVWVFIDSVQQGTYELPVTFPVLNKGVHTITLQPGIITNDNPTTRNPYYMVKSYSVKATLNANSIYTIDTVKTSYASDVVFDWVEGFELGTKSIDTNAAQTTAGVTLNISKKFAESGTYGAGIVLTAPSNQFTLYTKSSFSLQQGQVAFFEFNFKSTVDLTVGVLDVSPTAYTPLYSITGLNNSQGLWKKVYIDFSHVNDILSTDQFKIVISATKTSSTPTDSVCFDNFKLMHY